MCTATTSKNLREKKPDDIMDVFRISSVTYMSWLTGLSLWNSRRTFREPIWLTQLYTITTESLHSATKKVKFRTIHYKDSLLPTLPQRRWHGLVKDARMRDQLSNLKKVEIRIFLVLQLKSFDFGIERTG